MVRTTGGDSFRLSPPTNASRLAWPQYGYLLFPRSALVLSLGDTALGAITGFALYVFAVVVGVPSGATIATFAIVACALALSGTKVGQSRYSDELERTLFLAGLTGGSARRMYREATSRRGVLRACMAGFVVVCALSYTCWGQGAPVLTSCLFSVTVGGLVVAGLFGYQVCAQAAVLLNSFRLPQYLYLLFSVAVVAPTAILSMNALALRERDAMPAAGVLWITALVAGSVCLALLGLLGALEARLLEGRGAGDWIPQLRRTRRYLPLPVKLWTTRGRAYASVIMGLTAILAIVTLYAPPALSEAMRGLPGFKQSNIAVAVLYLVVLLAMHVVEAPLELKDVSRRQWLCEIVAIRRDAEMRGGAVFIIVASASTGLVSLVLLMRALPAVAALNPVTLLLVLSAVVLGASGLVLPAQADTTRLLAGPNMLARTFRSAFVALLASCMVVGFESAEKPGPYGLASSWLIMSICIWYLAAQVSHQVSGRR